MASVFMPNIVVTNHPTSSRAMDKVPINIKKDRNFRRSIRISSKTSAKVFCDMFNFSSLLKRLAETPEARGLRACEAAHEQKAGLMYFGAV
jgi:hypothetical protein